MPYTKEYRVNFIRQQEAYAVVEAHTPEEAERKAIMRIVGNEDAYWKGGDIEVRAIKTLV